MKKIVLTLASTLLAATLSACTANTVDDVQPEETPTAEVTEETPIDVEQTTVEAPAYEVTAADLIQSYAPSVKYDNLTTIENAAGNLYIEEHLSQLTEDEYVTGCLELAKGWNAAVALADSDYGTLVYTAYFPDSDNPLLEVFWKVDNLSDVNISAVMGREDTYNQLKGMLDLADQYTFYRESPYEDMTAEMYGAITSLITG